ncbi:MAG: hypothetical protein HQ521_01165 [Bacteroidetes bacterium]|nr:hypothetical protein [Bacteroidota bacterium]
MEHLIVFFLMLILCINSYAGNHFGNFSTPQVRKIVSNSVTIIRWTVVTVSDLITVYNKTDDAIENEEFENKDIIPTMLALANTSQWFPFAPEIRMVGGVLPSVFEYNIIKINGSSEPVIWSNETSPGFWFYGDEIEKRIDKK